MDGVGKEEMSQFIALKALRDKVVALPRVRTIYASAGNEYATYRD
jgi:hypothetical protein